MEVIGDMLVHQSVDVGQGLRIRRLQERIYSLEPSPMLRRASRYLSPDSSSHLLNIVGNRMLFDDAIALWVERDSTDGRPVARIA